MANNYEPDTPEWAVEKALNTIRRDSANFVKFDEYLHGRHKLPYIPDSSDAELAALRDRSILNLVPLVVQSITQACYVDQVRHSTSHSEEDERDALTPEMESWQRNRMDARQASVVSTLASHGVVYLLTAKDREGRARYEAYSGHRAVALYDDPVNDIDPRWGFIIKAGTATDFKRGLLYNETEFWEVTPHNSGYRLKSLGKHGCSVCPLSRAQVNPDLEGRPTGAIAPIIVPQDRINQTLFDILVVQSYGSHKVRTVSGMQIPVKRWTQSMIDAEFPSSDDPLDRVDRPSVGDPILDENGQEIPIRFRSNASRFLFAEDPDTKFGQLDETPLAPLLESESQAIKWLGVVSQTPPTYFMGELANLAAEALQAAEISKTRRDSGYKMSLGEAYERMLQCGMELEGQDSLANDVGMEIVWADTDPRSLGMIADAWSKLVTSVGVPIEAAWEELPGMTDAKMVHWRSLRSRQLEQMPEADMLKAMQEGGFIETVTGPGADAPQSNVSTGETVEFGAP